MHTWLGVVLGLALAGSVYGAERDGGSTPVSGVEQRQFTVRVGRTTLPVTFLGEVTGEAQDRDEFARKVGRILRDHSTATGTEACAMLCRSPLGTWGALPLTIGAHTACPIVNACPPGMTSTGVGIHSHPTTDTYIANAADMAVLGGDEHLRRRAGQRVRGGNPEKFSAEDFAGGEGYLATGTTLYHQAGKRSIRNLGSLDP